jgi:transposase
MVEMVRRGGSQRAVARKFRVSLHTVQRWWARAQGLELGAVDWSERSHVAHHIANKTAADMERKVCALRKELESKAALGF